MPPENVSAFSLARSARPTRLSISPTRFFSSAAQAINVADQHQVFFGRQLDVDALRLEDHADVAAHQRGFARDIVAHDQRAPAGGQHQGRENAEGRGLAAAVGTQQAEDLGRPHVERNPGQRDAISVLMAQVLQLNRWRRNGVGRRPQGRIGRHVRNCRAGGHR